VGAIASLSAHAGGDPPGRNDSLSSGRGKAGEARAALAIQGGFDGVEIHGGDGYLIDRFLRTTINRRTDRDGGSVERQVRFLADVTRAVAAEIGANRTGVCMAPYTAAADVLEEQDANAIIVAGRYDPGLYRS
jgi:2,4-dienoyl-CoA reductase-like NADH-dependent reductase (Old Yellow Enzyme family)